MTPEERNRVVSETGEILGEALVSHTMSDEEDELALLDVGLDDEHRALDRLADEDPLGCGMFGDRDDWIDSRLSRTTPK